MVPRRGVHLADGDLKRLRRRNVDVVDVSHVAGCSAGRNAGRNAILHRLSVSLRNGRDDHDGRRG
jgi:hypothetical protein